MNDNPNARYFYHPESDSLFVTDDGSDGRRGEPLCEEINADEYGRLKRKQNQASHVNAVRHKNCQERHCPICEGGLFQCADCGAAEIEAEEESCQERQIRLASTGFEDLLG